MALTVVQAHLACAALIAVDLLARSVRFRALLRAIGHECALRRALATSVVGDAASVLTPYRLGGDVARATVLARAGVRSRQAAVILLSEAAHNWIVILTLGGTLGWLYGRSWWSTIVAGIAEKHPLVRASAIAVAVGVIAGALAIPMVRRRRRRALPAASRERSAWPLRALASTLPLAFLSTAARVLVLPVLMMTTIDAASSMGSWLFGSFALLHGPMILPTPAGAGAVELGFLAQARAGGQAAQVLVAWRLYTSGVGLALGSAVAAAAAGRRLVRVWRRKRRSVRHPPAAATACEGSTPG